MREVKPERVLNVEWSTDEEDTLSVQHAITSYDRRGLLRDLTDVMALEHLSIEEITSITDKAAGTAHTNVKLAVRDLEQLARVLRRLATVPNVISARRVH
jgi:GTP pyrophosphokinase